MIAEHVNHFSLAQAMCTVKTKVLLLLSLAAVASVTKTAGDGFECITWTHTLPMRTKKGGVAEATPTLRNCVLQDLQLTPLCSLVWVG